MMNPQPVAGTASEAALYAAELRRLLERLEERIDGLDGAPLNWRPPAPGANSIYVIATHVMGNMEAFVLGIACGQPAARDRPAEFAASGEGAASLIERAHDLARRFEEALRAFDTESLGAPREAPQALWGAGPARTVSAREALIHTIEHAATHIGQIEITRDLALAQRTR